MTYIVIQFNASKSAPYGINQFVHPPTSLVVYSKKIYHTVIYFLALKLQNLQVFKTIFFEYKKAEFSWKL